MNYQGAYVVELSIVIPVFNEEAGISPLVIRLVPIIENITPRYEIIFVNDGSTDSTVVEINLARSSNTKIRLISLVKNYGHMEALSTGLRVSQGQFVLSMDGDLQHPPESIPEMYKLIKSNLAVDVIQAVRKDRKGDSLFKKITALIFYKFSNKVTGVPVIPNAADFRIMNRESVDVINSLPEKSKILRFLIPELGFRVQTLVFECQERKTGKSKYNLRKMTSFAFDSIFSFSTKPLRMMSIIGFTLSGVFALGTMVTFLVWVTAKTVPGWTSIFMLLLTSNALVLGSLGLLGEYISKIREATLGRPHSRWIEN
jgi:glycosyltransferase involved in cell wall biosynthesis